MAEVARAFCPWCGAEIYAQYNAGVLEASFTCECAMRYDDLTHRKHVNISDEYVPNSYGGGQ